MSELYLGELAALSTAILWTLSTLIWTAVGKQIGALSVSFIRVVMVCILLISCEWFFRGLPLPINLPPTAWVTLGLGGFCWFFLSDLCAFKSYTLIGPRLALLIMSLTPPMAASLSWACTGEKLSLLRWAAMFVTLAGVVWVISEQSEAEDCPHQRRHRTQGIALALLASMVQAVAFVLTKEGVGNCAPMSATLIAMLGALTGYLITITTWRRWPAVVVAAGHRRLMAVVLVGVVMGPFAGVAMNMIALSHAPTGVVATIIATMPVLIIPFSIFLHREKPSVRALLGAVVAVSGVAMLML